VRGHAVPKKRGNAVARSVIELVGDQELEGLQVLLQRADGADGNNPLDAKLFHGVDVGAIIDFRGEKAMPAPVTGKKCNTLPFESSDDKRVRRIAEWSLEAQLSCLFEPRHRVEAAATYNTDANRAGTRYTPLCWTFRLCHESILNEWRI